MDLDKVGIAKPAFLQNLGSNCPTILRQPRCQGDGAEDVQNSSSEIRESVYDEINDCHVPAKRDTQSKKADTSRGIENKAFVKSDYIEENIYELSDTSSVDEVTKSDVKALTSTIHCSNSASLVPNDIQQLQHIQGESNQNDLHFYEEHFNNITTGTTSEKNGKFDSSKISTDGSREIYKECFDGSF